MDRSETTSHAVLRDEILADAERQAKRILRNANREAQTLIDKATADSQRECGEKQAVAEALAERKHTLIFATVPVEIRRMRAARVEHELERLRDAVRTLLREREGFDYPRALEDLAVEALDGMEGEAFVLELSREDRSLADELLVAVRKRLADQPVEIVVASEPAEIHGGLIVRDATGRQVWINSLEDRLDRMWPLLRSQIAQQLGLQEEAEPSGGQS